MRVSQVSLQKIERLLKSVDEELEIFSISFVNDDYVLNFKKSLSNVTYDTNEQLLVELQNFIKKADKAFDKVLSNDEQGKNP